jgi:hypothetical protein
VAVGTEALVYNNTGSSNTATGFQALFSNTMGQGNTAVGDSALFYNTGDFNTAIGSFAGHNLSNGYRNVCIGYTVYGVPGENYTVRIADNVPTGAGQSACYIGGIAGQTVGAGGATCYVDNFGKLGVYLSARRYKQNIQPMDEASAALYALKPVTFRYKPELDKSGTPQFGLIAEEVAEVSPNLVTHNAEGELSTVRYEAVNVMLLNEFLKEHKAFVAEQRKVQKLEAALESVNRRLKEQEAKIERVSALVETSRTALQLVQVP